MTHWRLTGKGVKPHIALFFVVLKEVHGLLRLLLLLGGTHVVKRGAVKLFGDGGCATGGQLLVAGGGITFLLFVLELVLVRLLEALWSRLLLVLLVAVVLLLHQCCRGSQICLLQERCVVKLHLSVIGWGHHHHLLVSHHVSSAKLKWKAHEGG